MEYIPVDPKAKQAKHTFEEKTRKAMFIGYDQSTRTGGKWKGIYFAIDYEDIRNATSYKKASTSSQSAHLN